MNEQVVTDKKPFSWDVWIWKNNACVIYVK